MAVDVAEGLDATSLGAGEEKVDLYAVPVDADGGAVANAVCSIASCGSVLGPCVAGTGVVVAATIIIETPVEITSSHKRGGVGPPLKRLGNLIEL